MYSCCRAFNHSQAVRTVHSSSEDHCFHSRNSNKPASEFHWHCSFFTESFKFHQRTQLISVTLSSKMKFSYTQCICLQPRGHLSFRRYFSEKTAAPHFCYHAKAGFLLALLVSGGMLKRTVKSNKLSLFSLLVLNHYLSSGKRLVELLMVGSHYMYLTV